MSRQIPLLLLAVVASAPSPAAAQACLVPQNQIIAGGPGKDGIPALTQPAAVTALQGDAFLEPSALVLGVVVGGEARAYPHNVLWWHEIINDVVGGIPIVASYCPLTGSGIVFDPTLNGQVHNFGVSGLLFDNNLIMFDRTTESLWSQMRNQSICGGFSGREPVLLPVVQSTWAAWKALNPDTTVVNFDTGFTRRYDIYPYGNYDQVSDTSLLFPQSVRDGRRQLKELVLGIVHEGLARAYPYLDLGNRAAVNDDVNGRAVLVVYDAAGEMAIAFDRVLGEQTLSFELVEESAFPFHVRDIETGSLWTLHGEAVEGPLAGQRLSQVATFSAMWFAWASFHPGTEIFQP